MPAHWQERLTALGLQLPAPAKPVAAYVPAVAHGDLVYVSGQLPLSGGEVAYRGRVGGELSVADGQAAARLCALGALAAASAATPGGAADLVGVLRVEGFVQCAGDFHQQPQVINGASELLGALFPGAGHARIAVGVAALPLDAAVEVAVTFLCRSSGDRP